MAKGRTSREATSKHRLNRRAMLSGAAMLALAPSAARAETGLLLKTISSSGRRVPAIGMGSWLTCDVGDDAALRRVRTDVVRTFFAMGGEIIDSSPMYGSSQAVIGHALDRRRRGRPRADRTKPPPLGRAAVRAVTGA